MEKSSDKPKAAIKFVCADAENIEQLLGKLYDDNVLKRNIPIYFISSGLLTRFCLHDPVKCLSVLKALYKNNIKMICLSGLRQLLVNERMLKQVGFLPAETRSPGDLKYIPVLTAKRIEIKEQVDKLSNKIKINASLDLACNPSALEILNGLAENQINQLKIVDLSFSTSIFNDNFLQQLLVSPI